MDKLPTNYLTKEQAIQKYAFLTGNMLKNLLFKNRDGFKTRVARKLGRRVLLDEQALLSFIAESKCDSKPERACI